MAKAVIVNTSKSRTSTAKSTDYAIPSIEQISHSSSVQDINHDSKPVTTDYGIAKITDIIHDSKLESILPFYVRFTNIGIEGGYGPSNPAPIGIAVIGVNNYIL
jgi:hypothetical protein